MSKSRKDDHIKLARMQDIKSNRFDDMILEGTDLPNLSMADIDLSTTFLGNKIPYPIYINAMTGGSDEAYRINEFLAKIANHFNIPMVTGSQSIMFKDPKAVASFEVIRKHHDGILVGNVNPNMTLKQAKEAVTGIQADALSIHLNVIQELVMTEGDRDFRHWSHNIAQINQSLNVPVIVKQVGLGLSNKTIKELKKIGIKYIDVAGSGGTSFIEIESKRSGKNYSYLNDFSIDTLDVLLNLQSETSIVYYASGGIRNPLDVIKSLVLGAKACGLSKWFLDLTYLSMQEALTEVESFIEDLKKIMIILGARSLKDLNHINYKLK